MAKKYDIHYFSYINNEKGMNTLNGTKGENWEEMWDEYPVLCFDGLAFYSSKFPDSTIHYFSLTYPKFNNLNSEDKEIVGRYCGYYPNGGEYGVVCGGLGKLKEITQKDFMKIVLEYPVKAKDRKELIWL